MAINALALAEATKDAHSYERYGVDEWLTSCIELSRLGLSARDAEIVLRSKVMRWAADYFEKADGSPEPRALQQYVQEHSRPFRRLALRSKAGRALS